MLTFSSEPISIRSAAALPTILSYHPKSIQRDVRYIKDMPEAFISDRHNYAGDEQQEGLFFKAVVRFE